MNSDKIQNLLKRLNYNLNTVKREEKYNVKKITLLRVFTGIACSIMTLLQSHDTINQVNSSILLTFIQPHHTPIKRAAGIPEAKR